MNKSPYTTRGKGVAQNDGEAVIWYKKSAEQGNAFGQNNLGQMLETGKGIKRDAKEAVAWYKKAAQQGNEEAQTNLKRLGLDW